MKNKKIVILLMTINIIMIIVIICSFTSKNIINERQIIKEMSESTQVTDLNNQINQLNASHTEYANYVKSYKQTIATAITNQGVNTTVDATAEVMAKNIGEILQAKTKATATAEEILNGQTAWINGSKVTGTMANNGELNWNPTTATTYTIPAGYYSGGTLDSSESYNAGYNNGYEAGINANKGINKFTITITTSATAINSSGETNASASVTYTYDNGTWTKGTIQKNGSKSAYIWSQNINNINATISIN